MLVVGLSPPSNFALISGIAWVWVLDQLDKAKAGCVEVRHNVAVAAPAMRRHLEIAMVMEPSLILADNGVSNWMVPRVRNFFAIV
jgi:hypothetical protein